MTLIFAIKSTIIINLRLNALIRQLERMRAHVIMISDSLAIVTAYAVEGVVPTVISIVNIVSRTIIVGRDHIAINILSGEMLSAILTIAINTLKLRQCFGRQRCA